MSLSDVFVQRIFVAVLDQKPLAIACPHQHERALQLLAKQGELEFAFRDRFGNAGRVLGPVDAKVPNHHRAAAVFAFRDHAFKVGVGHRVIFDVHRHALHRRIHRRASRDGPRQEHTIGFETKVVMQLRRAVLLHDEDVPHLGSFLFRTGLGRFVEAALLFVFS